MDPLWTDAHAPAIADIPQDGVREHLEREQRSLSRKERGSKNWTKQRQRVADVHARMTAKKRDYKPKLAHFYTTKYDAVFVEDLNVKGMLEASGNARNKAEVGWRELITILQHHGQKNACHVVEVNPRGTTKECASSGFRRRSRCGSVNTRVQRVGSRQTEMRMRRGTSFLAASSS